MGRNRSRRRPSIGPAILRRRLLVSYLALTAVILLLLELPLGELYARRERDALNEEVRQLRAAVQLYTEVVRRLQVESPPRVA